MLVHATRSMMHVATEGHARVQSVCLLTYTHSCVVGGGVACRASVRQNFAGLRRGALSSGGTTYLANTALHNEGRTQLYAL